MFTTPEKLLLISTRLYKESKSQRKKLIKKYNKSVKQIMTVNVFASSMFITVATGEIFLFKDYFSTLIYLLLTVAFQVYYHITLNAVYKFNTKLLVVMGKWVIDNKNILKSIIRKNKEWDSKNH